MTDEAAYFVDMASGVQYDLEAVRQRKTAFMPDNEHAWVLHIVYGIDDPDTALNDMELGLDQFIGATQIHCLLCHVNYRPDIRHHKCPQQKPAKRGVNGN